MTSCALSLYQYRVLERRTLDFKADGTGLEYTSRVCKSKLVVFSKCETIYDEYLFSDIKLMKELAMKNFKAKIVK
jgi:hypothetical protein